MTGLLLGDKNDMNGLAGKTQLLRCTTFVASRRSTYLVLARLASSRATTDCYVLYVMNKSHKCVRLGHRRRTCILLGKQFGWIIAALARSIDACPAIRKLG